MTVGLRPVPGRWRRLSLRARLTLLVAAAVGVAVAVVAVAGYVFTRNQLRAQLDGALLLQARAFQAGPPLTPGEVARLRADRSLGPLLTSFQLLRPDGTATRPAQQALSLPVDAADLAVARGSRPLHLRDVTVDGARLRVATLPYGDGAVQISRSLREVDRSLARLRLLLGVLALVGIATSSTVGLLVARAGLAPVERLTGAAEHIAATEDMSAPIDVTGHDEVARLARSFNAMLTALDASRQRQRQLVADAGHELRTPLASLRANIEMLVRERRHPSRRLSAADGDALLADLTAQLDELAVLVNELVDLARDEHPDEPAGPVALDRVVDRSVRRAQLRAAGLRFEVRTEPWLVHGRSRMLERAVTNLLDNAVKWSPRGGRILVTLLDGTVTVTDQGPGVPAEDLPRVFDRFYRAASARGLPGSGLGLAIVKQIADVHGGTATLAPGDGGGTTAHLSLPGCPTPGG